MEDFKFGVFHPMQQHVHPGEIIGGDVLFLPEDLADRAAGFAYLLAHVEQEGAGAAGKIHHAFEVFLGAAAGFLAIEGNNAGEDVGYLLRGVELASLLARAGGKLPDQIFIGITKCVDICGELRQPIRDPLDDGAQLAIAIGVGAAQLLGSQVDLREQALERALKRLGFNVFEAGLERVEQLVALDASLMSNARPEMGRLDHIMDLAAHLLFKGIHILWIELIPDA